jgi:phage gp37-like protein
MASYFSEFLYLYLYLFFTGVQMIDITLFEQEIISVLTNDPNVIVQHKELAQSDAKLSALETLRSLAHVESYQGNIEDIVMSTTVPLPAALVIYGGARNDNAQRREGARGKVDASFSVFVVGQNLMNATEASKDVRVFLSAVRAVLNGLVYSDRVLLWTSESLELISNTGVCAYEQGYQYKDFLTS